MKFFVLVMDEDDWSNVIWVGKNEVDFISLSFVCMVDEINEFK